MKHYDSRLEKTTTNPFSVQFLPVVKSTLSTTLEGKSHPLPSLMR
jgi:hypothetical protein